MSREKPGAPREKIKTQRRCCEACAFHHTRWLDLKNNIFLHTMSNLFDPALPSYPNPLAAASSSNVPCDIDLVDSGDEEEPQEEFVKMSIGDWERQNPTILAKDLPVLGGPPPSDLSRIMRTLFSLQESFDQFQLFARQQWQDNNETLMVLKNQMDKLSALMSKQTEGGCVSCGYAGFESTSHKGKPQKLCLRCGTKQ